MQITIRKAASTLSVLAIMTAATPALAENTIYMNFGHMPIYSTDTDNGDTYGNSFEFGVYLEERTRMGVYHEQMSVEDAGGNNPSITGLATEHDLLQQDKFASAIGIMIGNDGMNNSASDIYGRFMLTSSEHTNINARVAYRTQPATPVAAADDLNGMALSIGFGLNF